MNTNQTEETIDFIVIGTGKSGTTWLADMLRQHPDIFIPERKELHYFNQNYGDDTNLDNLNYGRPREWYLNFFRDAKVNQIKGEVTPQYYSDPATAEGINNFNPEIKLIAVIREPVERTFSALHYHQFRGGKFDLSNFRKMLEDNEALLNSAKYYIHLRRFYDIFPAKNIKVLLFDDLKKDKKRFLSDIHHFLGVRVYFPESIDRHSNITGQVRINFVNRIIRDLRRMIRKYHLYFLADILRVTGIDQLAMQIVNKNILPLDSNSKLINDDILAAELRNYFSEDILQLETLIDQDLSAWKV